jgi:YD repeat-containing protein
MRTTLQILTFLLIQFSLHGQETKLIEIIELNPSVDSLNNRIVKSFDYDSIGNLISVKLNHFQNLDSKYRSNGHWIHKYKNNKLLKSMLIERDKGDTILHNYKHFGNSTWLTKKELVTRSKVKDGFEYGDGTPNGCIVPPEALEFYKVWVTRFKRKTISKKDKPVKEQIYFDHRTNPHKLKYEYNKKGNLVKIINTNRRTKQLIWEENYSYSKDSIVRTRQYFITYWDKIPPTESEVDYIDSKGLVTKTILKNSKDRLDGIIENIYEEGLLKTQTLFDLNEELIRSLEYKYGMPGANNVYKQYGVCALSDFCSL